METRTSEQAFYGTSLTSRNFGDFVMMERQYPGGAITPVHTHSRALFCVVLDGAYEERQSRKRLQCTRSTTLFHAAEEDHLERFADCGARSLIVELEPAWLGRVREVSRVSIENSAAQDSALLRAMGSRLYREFLTGDVASRLIIEGVLWEITGEFFRAAHRHDTRRPLWLGRAVEMIQESFPRKLTLASIADEVGVHPVYLAQSFRRFHGCTVGDYLRRIRIDYACRELVRSDASLVTVAIAAGFVDQGHFTRTFRRVVGVAPSQYRASVRGAKKIAASSSEEAFRDLS